MSYGVAAALQAAVYQRLAGDCGAGGAGRDGGVRHRAVRARCRRSMWRWAREDARDRSDKTGRGADA